FLPVAVAANLTKVAADKNFVPNDEAEVLLSQLRKAPTNQRESSLLTQEGDTVKLYWFDWHGVEHVVDVDISKPDSFTAAGKSYEKTFQLRIGVCGGLAADASVRDKLRQNEIGKGWQGMTAAQIIQSEKDNLAEADRQMKERIAARHEAVTSPAGEPTVVKKEPPVIATATPQVKSEMAEGVTTPERIKKY